MLPNVRFLGMSLYDLMLSLGIISALAVYYVCLEKRNASLKFELTTIAAAGVSIAFGGFSASLFQSLYTYIESGAFSLKDSGSTFFGGLIGGAGMYFLLYFTVGRKICKDEIKNNILMMTDGAFCAITLAHSLGRLGCFFVGCCHGIESKYGIYFESAEKKLLPTQLYESIFLLLLFFVIICMYIKKKGSPTAVYLISYGVFRFLIEFIRGDERGELLPFISPSQFWSVALTALGVCTAVYVSRKAHRKV